MLQILVNKICLKVMHLKFKPDFSGANELIKNSAYFVKTKCQYIHTILYLQPSGFSNWVILTQKSMAY